MLHYCTHDEVNAVIQSAERFKDTYDTVRAGVTRDFNAETRRNLEYEDNVVEYFDTGNVPAGSGFNIWLGKKRIVPGSVVVNYDLRREWSDENVIIPDYYTMSTDDLENGKLACNFATKVGHRLLMVRYSGGYPPRVKTPSDGVNPAVYHDAMDCPEDLRAAAIAECSFRLDKLLNVNVGNEQDVDKKWALQRPKTIRGMLPDTISVLARYKRLFGRVF